MQHLQVQAPEASQQALRDYLGRWQFAGERAFESVDGFSGGERARLALALLAWHRPNVLLLDEPTNHLDQDMREALAEALADFPGAIVLVSHDRHLVGLVCDSFWRAADGRVEAFEGDLDDYAAWLRGRNAGNKTDAGETRAEVKRKAKLQARPKIDPAVGRRLKRIEKRLEEIQVERERVEQALADPDLYERAGAERVTELGIRQAELAREQERLEEEWLELA
jgi:ATP-binding cassette subfamily F protein 3